MTSSDRELDILLQEFWRGRGTNLDTAVHLRNLALRTSPTSALLTARCLDAMDCLPSQPAWDARIDDLRTHLARLVRRSHQIDQIGDKATEPEAIFQILDGDADGLAIDKFDPDALRRARLGKANAAEAAIAFLDVLGWQYLPSHVAEELQPAASELSRRSQRYRAYALFADANGRGFALGLQVARVEQSGIHGFGQADAAMRHQAEAVLGLVYPNTGVRWDVEWELSFGGGSIGLGLYIAALVDQGMAAGDPLLAATGRIDATGRITGVDGVPAKIRAAMTGGFRRVLVPADNADEARAAAGDAGLITIEPVERTDQVRSILAGLSGAVPIGYDGTIRYLRKLVPLYELDLVDENPIANGYRLTVADAAHRASIDVFAGRKGTVRASGQSSALASATRLIDERLPTSRIQNRSAISVRIDNPGRRDRLQTILTDRGAEPLAPGQHEAWRYRVTNGPTQAQVIMYSSGKCVISNGQAPAHDEAYAAVRSVLEGLGGLPEQSSPTTRSSPTQASTDETTSHIGTDEAGKGDYFGPLVCAAYYVDKHSAALLRQIGVRDSKTLGDRAIRRLAAELRRLGNTWAVTTIQPARYNQLYAEMRREGKNLNTLVAWGHARSIEDLLGKGVTAEYVVIDKFADERYMREKILADTRRSGLRLDQRTKGESDIAVAAASILARDAFVSWIEERSRRLDITLPKGASDKVIQTARQLVAEHGRQALGDLAKLSFKTTQTVLEAVP